jgi:hypothetical protein
MLNSSKCFEKKKKYFFETCSLIWLIGGKVILFVYILISWWCSVLNVHFCTLCTENDQLYIFVYNLGAHTMLGTVIQLHNLATVYVFCFGLFGWQNGLGPSWTELYTQLYILLISCFYCTVQAQLTGESMASVLSTNHRRCWKMTEMV